MQQFSKYEIYQKQKKLIQNNTSLEKIISCLQKFTQIENKRESSKWENRRNENQILEEKSQSEDLSKDNEFFSLEMFNQIWDSFRMILRDRISDKKINSAIFNTSLNFSFKYV